MLAYEVNEMPPMGLIFSPVYMKHIKKYIWTKITQFLPRVPDVVKCISCEHLCLRTSFESWTLSPVFRNRFNAEFYFGKKIVF